MNVTNEKQIELLHFNTLLKGNIPTYPYFCDGLINNVLLEYKQHINIDKDIAQGMSYLKKFKIKNDIPKPRYLLVLNDRIVSVINTNNSIIDTILDDDNLFLENGKIKSPSNPKNELVQRCSEINRINFDLLNKHEEKLIIDLIHNSSYCVQSKLLINKNNMKRIFTKEWMPIFGNVASLDKMIDLFLIDIKTVSLIDITKNKIQFENTNDILNLNINKYNSFWHKYNRINSSSNYTEILSLKYILKDITTIRKMGEYYTPIDLVEVGQKYINETIIDTSKYKWYDPCGGTGNLITSIPKSDKVFISTIEQSDVDICKKKFKQAIVWKMNFIDLDYNSLNNKLLEMFHVDNKDWIFIINPPYSSGTSHTYSRIGINMKSQLQNHKTIHNIGTGEIGTYALMNILNMIKHYNLQNVFVSMYVPVKWFQLVKFRKFANEWAKYFTFISGFAFSGTRYQQAEGYWQGGFMLWKIKSEPKIEEQNIKLDFLDDDNKAIDYIEIKINPNQIILRDYLKFINNNIIHNSVSIPKPCLVNTFKPKIDKNNELIMKVDQSNVIANYWYPLSLSQKGMQILLSWAKMPSIYYDTLEENLAAFTAHIITKVNNKYHGTVLCKPNTESDLYNYYIKEATIYSLFATENHTSSFCFKHNNTNYDIRNNMFILKPSDIINLNDVSDELILDCRNSKHVSSMTKWLDNNYQTISPEGKEIIDMAKNLYTESFKIRKNGQCQIKDQDGNDIQLINRYDAGWHQLTRECKLGNNDRMKKGYIEFKDKFNKFKTQLQPLVFELKYL